MLGVAIVLAVLVAAACTGGDDDATTTTTADPGPRSGGTLRVGLSGPVPAGPGDVSPGRPDALLAAGLLWGGLTDLDDEGRAVPGIALEWTADDDATTWELTLDPDATFSDGTGIDAAAVIDSIERIAALGGTSLAATRLEIIDGHDDLVDGDADGLAGLSAPSDDVVVIELIEPFGALPELLASPVYGIAPAPGDDPVGSGPFEVEALDEGAVRLTPRSGFTTYVDAIELISHDSAEDAVEALAAGDVDLVPIGPGVELDLDLDTALPDGAVLEAPLGAEVFLGLRVDAPPLDQRAVRRAIAAGIDREELVEAAYGDGARPLATLVPEGVLGHDPEACGALCDLDPDLARDLLDDAFPDGEIPPVQLDIDDVPSQRAFAAALADQLAELDITVEVESWTSARYARLLAAGDQAAFTFGWIGLHPFPDAYLAPLLGETSPDNYTGFGRPALDELVAETRRTEGPGDLDLWAEVEADVLDAAVLVPIAQLQVRVALAARVADLTVALDGTIDPTTVWLTDS